MTDYDFHVFLVIFFDKQLLISHLHSFQDFESFKTCQWERPSATFRVNFLSFC